MNKLLALSILVMTLVVGALAGWWVQNQRWAEDVRVMRAENKAYMEAVLANSGAGQLGVPTEAQGNLSIFILAGQSNMSGRGVLPETTVTDPRIFMLGNDGRWKLASEPVDNPAGQVDMVSYDNNAGVSPGMAFALEILKESPEMYVGLVPVAMGATSLHQWRRVLTDTMLYGSLLKRAKAAEAMGRIEGFLWFQGEADARRPTDRIRRPLGNRWHEGFEQLVSGVRKDLDLPNLPVVYAQIGTHRNPETYPHWELVKDSQTKVELPATAMITTEDLDLMDKVHFTSDAYIEIGRRFAHEYLTLTTNGK